MAYTQAQLDALDALIASGVQSVRNEDDGITYNGTAALIALRQTMQASIDAASATPSARQVRCFTGKGL